MQENIDIIRIGTSPMTPARVLIKLWSRIYELCPVIKIQRSFWKCRLCTFWTASVLYSFHLSLSYR